LLRQVAQLTGGRMLSEDDAMNAGLLFDRGGLSMPVRAAPIWLPVALAALGMFLIDAGVRRVRLDVMAMRTFIRRAFMKRRAASEQQIGALKAARERTQEKLARKRAGEAMVMGGMSQQRDVAGAKFEADATARPEPLVKAPLERVERRQDEAPAEEEAGMSRLMRAKMRAREGMDDE